MRVSCGQGASGAKEVCQRKRSLQSRAPSGVLNLKDLGFWGV